MGREVPSHNQSNAHVSFQQRTGDFPPAACCGPSVATVAPSSCHYEISRAFGGNCIGKARHVAGLFAFVACGCLRWFVTLTYQCLGDNSSIRVSQILLSLTAEVALPFEHWARLDRLRIAHRRSRARAGFARARAADKP